MFTPATLAGGQRNRAQRGPDYELDGPGRSGNRSGGRGWGHSNRLLSKIGIPRQDEEQAGLRTARQSVKLKRGPSFAAWSGHGDEGRSPLLERNRWIGLQDPTRNRKCPGPGGVAVELSPWLLWSWFFIFFVLPGFVLPGFGLYDDDE